MKILKMIMKAIGLRKVVTELLDQYVEPAIDKAVKRSKTQLDNKAKDALYPILKEELLALVDKL